MMQGILVSFTRNSTVTLLWNTVILDFLEILASTYGTGPYGPGTLGPYGPIQDYIWKAHYSKSMFADMLLEQYAFPI